MRGIPRGTRQCRTPSLGSDSTASPEATRHAGNGREGFSVDREKALDMALGQIEKQFGKGSIMKLGERGNVGVEAIRTGALALDLALGIGGLPRGRTGLMSAPPEPTRAGRPWKFYSWVRLDIRRIETIKDGAEAVGTRVRVRFVKNKTSPPFKQAEFDIMYGKGISREGSLLDVAVDLGIVKKSGAWFTYEGEQLGQGRENVKTFLAENVDMMVEISEKVRAAVGVDEVIGVDLPAEESE